MRAVLGVVIALVAMSALVFALSIAPWLVLGVDGVMEPGRFDTVTTYDVSAIVVAALGAVFSGRLCMAIGRSKPAVVVLAVLGFVGGMTNAYAHHAKPEPGPRVRGIAVMDAVAARKEPAWFTLLIPCLGIVVVLVGGRQRRGA